MQRCFLIPAALVCTVTALPAATSKLANLQVGRYTRQGTNVLVESGIFQAPSGKFIPDKASTYPETTLANYGMTPAIITAISGKLVAFSATVDIYNQTNPGFLDNYAFSKAKYQTVGGTSYIVTLATGGTGGAPTLTVKASKPTVTEGPKVTTSFDITLSKAAATDTSVVFELSGTAKSVSDYVSSANLGFVKIKKGKKTASVKITIKDDKLKEPTEKLIFTVKPHASYKLGAKKSATVTIKDNDK